MNRSMSYSPEIRERAVWMVIEHQADYDSQWAAMNSIAAKIGCTAETLRKWVRLAERDQSLREGVTSSERERLEALECENCELKRAKEILRKTSAFFPPRRSSTENRDDGGVLSPTVLGIDLIYINAIKQNVVMVQYKMLEPCPHNGETDWIYRPDLQLAKEIARMKRFSHSHPPETLEYRINPQVYYLKFVKGMQH